MLESFISFTYSYYFIIYICYAITDYNISKRKSKSLSKAFRVFKYKKRLENCLFTLAVINGLLLLLLLFI